MPQEMLATSLKIMLNGMTKQGVESYMITVLIRYLYDYLYDYIIWRTPKER